MPVYNAEKYLRAALNSVLAQTLRDFEIVAVDDGSTDGSGKILEEYASRDARVRLMRQKNAGHAAARNAAAAVARGRYIAMHDADDVFHPDRLEKQAAALDARPDLIAVFCRTVVTDENLKPLAVTRVPTDPPAVRRAMRCGNPLQQNPMIRREAYEKIGGYHEAFVCSSDFDFNLRLLDVGEVMCLPEAYHVYRQHGGQNSVTKEAIMPMLGALIRTFALERKLRGRDSYAEFNALRDPEKFLPGYEFRNIVYYLAGMSSLKHLFLPRARAYTRLAWKGGRRTFGAAWLYGKTFLPLSVLKTVSYVHHRFIARKWNRRIPPYIVEMLSTGNRNSPATDK
jgi:glycosyltransferase involved in cell wall biosynthesis